MVAMVAAGCVFTNASGQVVLQVDMWPEAHQHGAEVCPTTAVVLLNVLS